MSNTIEQRREKRLRYNWPVWFAEDYNDSLTQGQMVDISSSGASFTCYADRCPIAGEHITARFSVPRHGPEDAFDLENFMRAGHVCRVDELGPFVRRVALQFSEPLPFKPGEIEDTEALAVTVDDKLKSIEEREAEAMAEGLEPNATPNATVESVGT